MNEATEIMHYPEWSDQKLREIADAEQACGGVIIGPPAHANRWYILSRDRGHGHSDFLICDACMRILPLNEEQAVLMSLAPDLKARCEFLLSLLEELGPALVLAAGRWNGSCDCQYCNQVHAGVSKYKEFADVNASAKA